MAGSSNWEVGPEPQVIVSKKEAVGQLMDAGIDALEREMPLAAITLFGAAEEAMPRVSEASLFQIMKVAFGEVTDGGEKAVADSLNYTRNWLKHSVGEDAIEIAEYECLIMFLRAKSRFDTVYGVDQETNRTKNFFELPPGLKWLRALRPPVSYS